MVLVEFFDIEPLDNMIGCLSIHPDKVYFVGESKFMKRQLDTYKSFLSHHGIHAEINLVPVSRSSLSDIVEKVSAIVEKEDECCFDLTGGADLLLVAVGMIYERYKDRKKLVIHRYNVRKNTVSLCEKSCDAMLERYRPAVMVEEGIALHGGAVPTSFVNGKRDESWQYTDDFVRDVDLMWNIAKRNPSAWNSQTATLSGFESIKKPSNDTLLTVVDVSGRKNIPYIKRLLNALYKAKLITQLENEGKILSYRFKNNQVKRCILKSGNVLELKTLITARKLKNEDGSDFYSDSTVQVCIDWDGRLHDGGNDVMDTANEIDVMLMKELVPVFISCKNGSVGDDELYKLNTVTSRFGGKYAKKVLVATHLGKKGQAAKYFRQRASDMNIILIDDVHTMDDETFSRRIKSIVM